MPVIKESSDELNPPEVRAEEAGAQAPAARKGLMDYIALTVATCGVGYLPLAPGTWGSVVGVLFYLAFQTASLRAFAFLEGRGLETTDLYLLRTSILVLLIALITLAGVWAATRAEILLRRKDPGAVVVDEVAGQMITFVFVPARPGFWMIIGGFILFRLFDIWKPYPVRRLEALEAGLGVMGDDVLAGIYAAITLSLAWLAVTLTG